jgi:hypothetical protein
MRGLCSMHLARGCLTPGAYSTSTWRILEPFALHAVQSEQHGAAWARAQGDRPAARSGLSLRWCWPTQGGERGAPEASEAQERPRILPDSRSMSMSKKQGRVDSPGIVDMVPMIGYTNPAPAPTAPLPVSTLPASIPARRQTSQGRCSAGTHRRLIGRGSVVWCAKAPTEQREQQAARRKMPVRGRAQGDAGEAPARGAV